jgi:hypothetical protein
MRRESHVRFWEGVEVRFLRATRLIVLDDGHLRRLLAEYLAYVQCGALAGGAVALLVDRRRDG